MLRDLGSRSRTFEPFRGRLAARSRRRRSLRRRLLTIAVIGIVVVDVLVSSNSRGARRHPTEGNAANSPAVAQSSVDVPGLESEIRLPVIVAPNRGAGHVSKGSKPERDERVEIQPEHEARPRPPVRLARRIRRSLDRVGIGRDVDCQRAVLPALAATQIHPTGPVRARRRAGRRRAGRRRASWRGLGRRRLGTAAAARAAAARAAAVAAAKVSLPPRVPFVTRPTTSRRSPSLR